MPHYRTLLIGFTIFWIIIGLQKFNVVEIEKNVSAQLPGCAEQALGEKGWEGVSSGFTTVFYWFDPNHFGISEDPDGIEKQQINDAFGIWQAAFLSCTRIIFSPTSNESIAQIKIRKRNSGDTESDYDVDALTGYTFKATLWFRRSDYNSYLSGYNTFFLKATLHELGHTFGLEDAPVTQISGKTVMNNIYPGDTNELFGRIPTNLTACDLQSIRIANPQCSFATPSPTPEETPPIPIDLDCILTECWQPDPNCACYIPGIAKAGESCPPTKERIVDAKNEGKAEPLCICPTSPILIDVLGNGYALTSAENGVTFDFNGDGIKKGRMSWTSPNSDDAWLVLDRNGNGTIDSAKEMFGNPTPQPGDVPFNQRNGFIALAEFDKRENGGNPDGGIDKRDNVFNYLRLWQDFNHNGISEPDELKPLPVLGIEAIELDYKESKKTDEFGNAFRFRAKIWDKKGVKAGHWAWDVFLRKAQ